MFNGMKQSVFIPECLRTGNIIIIHKKGNTIDLNNWRGIFVTSVQRTIIMKILHERIYHTVALDMTDSQNWARKKKSVRYHIFVLNSIISDVLSSVKKEPIDVTVMDYRQIFDAEVFSRPGRSQGLLYKQSRHSLIKWVSLFLPQHYGAATPKRLEMALPVIN